MRTKFDTLYKQTSAGKVQQWTVSVDGNAVTVEYGLTDGKKQTTTDIVKEGKNLGKANATTPEEQARLQAKQEHDAKLKEGYVPDMATAASTKNTLQAVEPMLAHPLEKKERYATFPAFAQPKLDGLRCIAIVSGGKARLFSRTQKEYLTVPHIALELGRLYCCRDIVLDGELYSHEFKDDFNAITHLAKRDGVHEDAARIQYHVYDVVAPGDYATRTATLVEGEHCRLVRTRIVHSREELEAFQAECVADGYEGCMYRNPKGEYEHKRSAHLLKVKSFQDEEFEIVGVEEGTGKLMGAAGAIVLVTKAGARFGAKPACTLAQSQEYWRIRESLVGKRGTVKFQALTPDGIPRFPVFKAVRDE